MSRRRTTSMLFTTTLAAAVAVLGVATAAGAFSVTALEASVSPPSYTGPCPTTFTFTGQITADGPGLVTYQWAHYPFVQVAETVTFAGPGTQTVTYNLVMDRMWPANEGHWLDFSVASPNFIMYRPPVSFQLVCRKPSPPEPQFDRVTPVSVTLKDGSPAVVVGDRLYLMKRGRRLLAPDGTYELDNGAKLVVKDGKIVKKTPARRILPRKP